MLDGIDLLREAEASLRDCEGTLRERVLTAAEKVWSAEFYRERWPEALQQRADRLNERLLAGGPISRTVEQLDEAALTALADEIGEFVVAAERLALSSAC